MSYKEDRKFSVPYSAEIEPEEYLNFIKEYDKHIENIFMGIPIIDDHVSLQDNHNKEFSYDFLEKSKGKYKRIITFNSMFYDMEFYDLENFVETKVYPIIEKYSIDGFILTNLGIAEKLHRDFPKLELHTSCNCYQYTIRQMEYWREYAGISVFNPPREYAKTPERLKEMHDAGFKLKVLVNEACIYGCPYQINHACEVSSLIGGFRNCCDRSFENIFKTNLFLPRWLDYIDDYVDIYKLAGRASSLDKLKKIFDAYILQKDIKFINDFATYGDGSLIHLLEKKYGMKISQDIIPEKTRYCECKECGKTCSICADIIKRLNIK